MPKTRKRYEHVVAEIVAEVDEGVLRTGQKLPSMRTLASKFKVSRLTLREAMVALECMGYVFSKQGCGTVVTMAEAPGDFLSSLLDVLEARRLLDGEIAALASIQIGRNEVPLEL